MAKTREDFMGDKGGFLDGVRGKIVDAIFEIASGDYADRVAAGDEKSKPPVVLTLTVESDELEKPAKQGYSVGGQDIWDIQEDGATIVNKKNPEKHIFRDGSTAHTLVESLAIAIGANGRAATKEDDTEKLIEEGQKAFIKRDYYVTDRRFFLGWDVTWATKLIERTIGDKNVKSRPPVPVIFHGVADAKAGATGTKKSAPAAAKQEELDPNDAELDQLLIDHVAETPGLDARALKSWAVRQPAIKANTDYMNKITSGVKTKQLEDTEKLIKDADGKYL